jgi:hypothetical protein
MGEKIEKAETATAADPLVREIAKLEAEIGRGPVTMQQGNRLRALRAELKLKETR